MKFVVTLMVRDEVDIIAAMVEHHLAQGAALVIATDNGSVDGTAEVLQAYADLGVVELHHDPVHRKQQRSVVTGMARRAFTEHGADWVVNADADEFFVPVDRSLTLQQALERTPTSLGAFTVPVFNMVGTPATRGSGVDRLLWRDVRPREVIQGLGIFAHPTADAIHRGDPDVVVQQGNHFVSIPSAGEPDPAVAIEVYHLPWRSWEQLERKTVNTGRSYDANPDLRPSPNHHVMTDWRRYQNGRLRYTYLLRLPLADAVEAGEADGSLVRDEWLRDHLHGLVATARRPDLLEACLDPSKDEPVGLEEHRRGVEFGRVVRGLEVERDEAVALANANHATAARIAKERDEARAASKSPWASVRRDARRVTGRARRTLGPAVRRARRLVSRVRSAAGPTAQG